MTSGTAQGSQTIDYALRVVDIIAERGHEGVRLTDIAVRSSLHKPQVHRVLTSLRKAGYVERVPDNGFYRLGPSFFRVAAQFCDASRLRLALHPLLEIIQQRIGQIVHLGVLGEPGIVYLDKVQPVNERITVNSAIGYTNPVLTTAIGRSIIAFSGYTDEQFKAYFADHVTARTTHSPSSLAEAWQRILETRERGYALDLEENDLGVQCIGFPILQSGIAVAALSVTGLVSQLGTRQIVEYAGPIREVLDSFLPAPYETSSTERPL